MMQREPKLSEYALIGNSCSAALVSRHGSIDWCCLPEFDSPSIFASLLDRKKGGHFSLTPESEYSSTQKYLDNTNVAETSFETSTGSVTLTDAFVAMHEEEKASSLQPDQEILRMIEGKSGRVMMKLEYSPALFYGRDFPSLHDRGNLGIQLSWKENILILLTTLPPASINVESDGKNAIAHFWITEGEKIFFSLSYSNRSPAVLPELQETGWHRMQKTIRYWRDWIGHCTYSGMYREAVQRSALALKLLAHAPSGAIIAAPTTSLPEEIGGEKNWDYRFCWLRDASFTTNVLVKLGFHEEVHAYMNWILHATQLTRPELQVVYSVYGHARLREKTAEWLAGYRNSKPVRIGNQAADQFQLDVYGEVLDAAYAYAPLIAKFDSQSKRFIIGLGKTICKIWNQPDNGIWEIRSSKLHHTHSKVMAWVGLDRLLKLCSKYEWKEGRWKTFSDTLTKIRNEIEEHGFNRQLDSYTRTRDGDDVDASLLALSMTGYCGYDSPRMISTLQRIRERLSQGNFIYRYRENDGEAQPSEGSFAICNFWLARNLAGAGKVDEAIKIFEATLACASPTGLLSEEIDPETGELLGNYPQGFTHIGLISAAISISEAMKTKERHKYEHF
jgi:GH15 family glucan-1,4-alpha-glucosidase